MSIFFRSGMRVGVLSLACMPLAGTGACQRLTRSTETAGCESLVVPAYMGPGPGWDTLIASAPLTGAGNRILVLNPNSGPGTAARANFHAVVERAQHSGQKVYGYVATGYGGRPLRSVEEQVHQYIDWYGVDGIFFDEVSEKAAYVPRYYQPLVTFTASQLPGSGVMLNNGTFPAAAYGRIRVPAGSRLQLVVFEHDLHAFTSPSFTVPRWIQQYPASMFVSIVYAVPAGQLPGVLRLSAQRHFGTGYVTDKDLPNPYGTLPTYWASLSDATQAGCGK